MLGIQPLVIDILIKELTLKPKIKTIETAFNIDRIKMQVETEETIEDGIIGAIHERLGVGHSNEYRIYVDISTGENFPSIELVFMDLIYWSLLSSRRLSKGVVVGYRYFSKLRASL